MNAGTTERSRNVWKSKGVIRARGVGGVKGGGVGNLREVGRCRGYHYKSIPDKVMDVAAVLTGSSNSVSVSPAPFSRPVEIDFSLALILELLAPTKRDLNAIAALLGSDVTPKA